MPEPLIPPPPSYPPSNYLPEARPAEPLVIPGTVIYASYDEPADGPSWWQRIHGTRNLLCCAVALAPVFGGWSLATAYAHFLHETWTEQGLLPAWILVAVPTAVGVIAWRCRAWWARPLLAVTVLAPILGLPIIGTAVYATTGVQP
jgi:hypothetical protein